MLIDPVLTPVYIFSSDPQDQDPSIITTPVALSVLKL